MPVGGSSSSESASVIPAETEQRVMVPPEVPQDTRSSIEDMEIGQLKVKREVRGVQGFSLDADNRELQRLARDSAEHFFRDKQAEASDSLIAEVGALLTESGGSTDHRDLSVGSVHSQGWRLGIETSFCT